MVKSLEAARIAAKRALEATYAERCTIIVHQNVTDNNTGLAGSVDKIEAEDVPCRVSVEKLAVVAQTETAAAAAQGVKLFLAPEVRVSSGSKIVVTQAGVTSEYCASGVPAVYPTHQEIMLELWKKWV